LRENQVKPTHFRTITKHFIQRDGKCSIKDVPSLPTRIYNLFEKISSF